MRKKFAFTGRVWVLVSCIGLFTGQLHAAVLYWGGTLVKTGSVRTCMSFAADAMRNSGMQNIRSSASEVTGTSGRSYAAITCVATNPNATAIVMVTGEDGGETMRVRDVLRQKIAGMIKFDNNQ